MSEELVGVLSMIAARLEEGAEGLPLDQLPAPLREAVSRSADAPPEAVVMEKKVLFDGKPLKTSFIARERLRPGHRIVGPAVVLEYSATTLIPPDFRGVVDEWFNLLIEL